MQFTQTVSMAFKAISGNKVRAFLTMLGVIIGVMSVIVLIAIGHGDFETGGYSCAGG